mmetsp:Transcript_20300/g.51969  ORF Transcript_20300/g.51969 Transcript_20300/m.51969 type:complete len:219 (+) Transcript_20300:903-1559(+)
MGYTCRRLDSYHCQCILFAFLLPTCHGSFQSSGTTIVPAHTAAVGRQDTTTESHALTPCCPLFICAWSIRKKNWSSMLWLCSSAVRKTPKRLNVTRVSVSASMSVSARKSCSGAPNSINRHEKASQAKRRCFAVLTALLQASASRVFPATRASSATRRVWSSTNESLPVAVKARTSEERIALIAQRKSFIVSLLFQLKEESFDPRSSPMLVSHVPLQT